MRYFIKTYGCQINKNDGERLATHYENKGFTSTKNWREATVIFLNTCSVRKAADDRVFALLNQMQNYFAGQKKYPQVLLSGCMARYGKKLTEKYWIINQVIPPDSVAMNLTPKRSDKTQAFIKISTGCNSFCTYCVVPYARSREKSRPEKDILAEVKTASQQGHHEITLLGQNVNSYGLEKIGIGQRKNDLLHNHDAYHQAGELPPFVALLQKISQLAAVKKIRFMTSNPWDFHQALIKEIGQNQKIDRFLHLPVQSGSNAVLARMNRGYTRENYLELINKLRTTDPNLTFGTDIIVGFPGETEADFQDTVDLVKKANFLVAFVAIYSPRSGTVAAKLWPDDVPHLEKKRRFEILDKLINKDQLNKRPRIV